MSWSFAINADALLACDASSPPPLNVDKEHEALRASVCLGGYWELCFESELETEHSDALTLVLVLLVKPLGWVGQNWRYM